MVSTFTATPIAVLCHVDDLGELQSTLIRAGFKAKLGSNPRERFWCDTEGVTIITEYNPDGASDGMTMLPVTLATSLLGVEVSQ